MAIPEAKLLEVERQIQQGMITVQDLKPEARQEYLQWRSSQESVPEEKQGSSFFSGALKTISPPGEVALTLGTGMAAQVAGGISGLAKLATGGSLEEVVNTIQDVSGNLTYMPRSQGGQTAMSALGTVMEPIERGINIAGEFTTDVTGSPLAGAGVRTLLEVGPSFFGVRNPVSVARSQRAGVNEANRLLREAGIEVNPRLLEQISIRGIPRSGRIAEILNQVPEAAAALSRSTQVRAQGLLTIQESVQRARRARRNAISQMYEQAKEAGEVTVPVNQVKLLNESLADAMSGFEFANAGQVRSLLSEFASIIEPSPQRTRDVTISRRGLGRTRISRDTQAPDIPREQLQRSVVELNDISGLRRKLSLVERGSNQEAAAAATVMKSHIDEWMTAQFNTDMMSGSADAIAKWRNANTAYREFSKIFKENKSMEMLFRSEATPEMVQNWIYGTDAAGASNESALVVKRLNQVLGKDSAEMQTLRNSAAFDIVYPLMRSNLDENSLNAFVANYTDFVKRNDSLAKELFSPQQLEAFDTLARTVRSARQIDVETPRIIPNVDRTIAIALLPSAQPLATGEAQLGIVRNALRRMRSIGDRSAAKRFYGSLSGVDMTQPLFSARTPAIASFIQLAQDQPDELDSVLSYLTGQANNEAQSEQ